MRSRRVLVVAVTMVAALLAPAQAGAVTTDGPPAVVSVLPQVAAPAGGTPIRVYGSGFEGTTAVTVGGVAALDFAVIDSKLLTAVVPPGAVNSLAAISVTDNQGSGASDDDTNRLRYTNGSVAVMPDTGLVGGEAVSVSVASHVPSASGVLLQLNPLAGLLENPPDWGGGPIPYAVPKAFPTLDASGSLAPTSVTLEAAFRGSQAGYDANNTCPVTHVMADHGIGHCQVVFSQFGVGSLEHNLSYATDPTPAPPTLVVTPTATAGERVTFSGLQWSASPYFGSDTAPDDPGETALDVELCTTDQSACAPVPADAAVAPTRYHDADATVPNVQPLFSGATLEGTFTLDAGPACAPTCLLRVHQEGYAYPAGGSTGSSISATAPLAVTGTGTTGCGTVISASITLSTDVGPCSGDGLIVGADNITLDLGGHRVVGAPGPADGHQAGIRLTRRTGVTVTNGTIEGFDAGVVVEGGAANTLSALTVQHNLGPDKSTSLEFTFGDGILLTRSSGNHILGNTVSYNGPYDGIGILGLGSNANVIDGNTVVGTVGTADGFGAGQGVMVNAFLDVADRGSLLEGNAITNNVVRGNASAGLASFNSAGATIEGNTVEGNGMTNKNGNGIALQYGPGVVVPVSGSVVRDNEVHGNALDGIQVGVNSGANQIVDNDARDNNAAPFVDGSRRGFDLQEINSPCVNVWSGNQWGSGGYNVECTTAGGSGPPPPPFAPGPTTADFDGGGRTDFSVFRPADGAWLVKTNSWQVDFWGASGDLPSAGDYDGDGRLDKAVFRPATGAWYVQDGASPFWGTSGDVPVPGDYDGDGDDDIAVFRPSTGAWFVRDGVTAHWGTSGDVPVPDDYDGDGDDDIAVFRPSTGAWFVQDGVTAFWGTSGDVPVPGDYDGDGATDIAVFRPSTGAWFIRDGSTTYWGTSGDIPVPGDYNANRITDIAVYRPSTGAWFIPGAPATFWGGSGDRPLPLPAAIYGAMSPT